MKEATLRTLTQGLDCLGRENRPFELVGVAVPRCTLAAVVLSVFLFSTAEAQTARRIAQSAFPSVVLLVMEDANGQPISLGSGFFVGNDVVATNLHVIEDAAKGYIRIVGQKAKHDVRGLVATDPRRDLALLKISGVSAPPLTLGDSRQVAVGDDVYAVGNPQGLEGTFSQGIVSGIRQIGPDNLFQITAPISPGSSGGPVLNSQGSVVGMAVGTFSGGQNLNFAIPASYLMPLLTETRPVLPLSPKPSTKTPASILADLGGRGTEGVVGTNFLWDFVGFYSFSLRNQLRTPVRNVICLVVFYDKSGIPLDSDTVQYREEIPAGLAKRVNGKVDGSVQRLIGRVEIRILDFRPIE